MGNMQATEFAESVREGGLPLEIALRWHLSSNHYPPVPLSWLPVCKKAIEMTNAGCRFNAQIDLPHGITSNRGEKHTHVFEVIRAFHLDAFLDEEETEC